MDFQIIATNNYATASKAVLNMLKKTDQTDLSTNHVVISNDRCCLSRELEMLDALGGSFNTHVLTFARLTTRLMKEKPFISKQSAIMLIGRLAEEMKDKFLCFKKSFNTAGFASNVYETISQLKYSAISPEQINPSEFDKNLQFKMHDIKLIYQAYEDFIKDRYIDSGAKLNHLIKEIPHSDFVKNSYFYVQDFDDFSVQEEIIIRQLVIYSKGVVVAIPYMPGKRIYPADNFENLCQIAKGLRIEPNITYLTENQPNHVSHLANNLFDYKTKFDKKRADSLFVSKESDVFAEVELVAKHICHQTRNGARYKDFLIVAGDVAKYAYAIERVFAKYNVAYFLDNKISLGSHALSQYLSGILNAYKNGFRREDCLAVIKNYFYVTNHDVCKFENVCLKNNLRFFGKPFEGAGDEILFAEQVRQEFVLFVDSFAFAHKDGAGAYVQKLKNFLQSDNMTLLVQNLCEQAKDKDDSLAKTSSQATDKILSVLDNLQVLFGDVVLTDQKFADLLQAGLDAETISIIPLYNDCVVVAGVAKARANSNKHLVVLGANDGDFPVSKRDTRIVSDGDIDLLASCGINLSPKTEKENFKEKFNVFQLLTAPRQSLFVTYLANGDKSTPCLAVEEILKMFEVDNRYVELLKQTEQVFGQNQAKEKLVAEMSKIADGNNCGLQQASNLFYALKEDDVFGFLFKGLKKQNLKKGKNVLLPKGKTAVTKIECFYSCPYKYFLQNGIKLKPREMGELKNVDTGVIIHDVLENFVKAVYVDKTVGDDFEVEQVALNLVAQVLKRPEYQYLANHPKLAHVLERIKKECVFACNEIFVQVQNSLFKPYATELGFGFDNCDLPPVKITADGHEVLLVGKIDRVDVCDDKFVLVDYKTGNVSFSENELYAGKKLQLLTYVKACLQAMQKQCAGFFYLPVNDAFQEEKGKRFCYVGRVQNDAETIYQLDTNSRQTGESSLFGKKLTKDGVLGGNTSMGINQQQLQIYLDYTQQMLQNAIKDMADGFVEQHPAKSACDFCDYLQVCNYQDLGGQEDNVSDISLKTLAEVTGNEI